MDTVTEPKGIGFFSVKTGETHYAKLEPTIAAYINSSDMGINASRGQDFGWRLDAEWVNKVKAFRRDRMQMQLLTAQNSGQKPTTIQILHFLYGEELRAYQEEVEEHENPFEDQYQRDIASPQTQNTPNIVAPAPLPGGTDDEISDEVDESDLVPDEDIDIDAAAEAATSGEELTQDQLDEIELKKMEVEEKAATKKAKQK